MASVRIQNAANLATIFAALVAAGSFYYGYRQFTKTQEDARHVLKLQEDALEQDRDSTAVELYVKYNEMMSQLPPRAKPGPTQKKEFWPENLGITIAESIFRLRKNDDGWKETVVFMLSNHESHLRQTGLNCPTYDAEFVKLANQLTKDDLCKARLRASSN